MTTSIVIPCHYKHIRFLPELLTYIAKQTVLPNEVVVSLQHCPETPPEELEKIKSIPWSFSLKIIFEPDGRGAAGLNRNFACEHSSGDLLICNDADDLPHPQRVEIIKHLFENYKIDFLIHRFIAAHETFIPYELDHAEQSFQHFNDYLEISLDRLHNGNIALANYVFNEIHWDWGSYGEDVWFNRQVFAKFRGVALNEQLIMYRAGLSVTRL